MDESLSGIFAEDSDHISFGIHFRGRSPEISDIVPNRGTPPELMYRKSQTDSTNVSKSTTLGHKQSESTASATSQYSSFENKWPEDENTYLVGDVKNWAKYRPNVDRSINFTALIEEKTIYDQSQMLRPHLFHSFANSPKSTYLSVDGSASQSLNRPVNGLRKNSTNSNMSSPMNLRSNIHVDGESTSKPASNGNSHKVTARAALGDISSKIQNTLKPRPPTLASQKWINDLESNLLDPVREVYEKINRQKRERENKIVSATTPITPTPSVNASIKVSKIPISMHRQKSPVPSRSQQTTTKNQHELTNNSTYLIEKFPLGANTTEVIWGRTPLGKSVTKTFSIRNSSDMMLRLKIDVIGAQFHVKMKTLDLQGKEYRDIDVTFCPNVIGIAMGRVIITPITTSIYWSADTERRLYLCAYGGE